MVDVSIVSSLSLLATFLYPCVVQPSTLPLFLLSPLKAFSSFFIRKTNLFKFFNDVNFPSKIPPNNSFSFTDPVTKQDTAKDVLEGGKILMFGNLCFFAFSYVVIFIRLKKHSQKTAKNLFADPSFPHLTFNTIETLN
jgi:hypothetical protein